MPESDVIIATTIASPVSAEKDDLLLTEIKEEPKDYDELDMQMDDDDDDDDEEEDIEEEHEEEEELEDDDDDDEEIDETAASKRIEEAAVPSDVSFSITSAKSSKIIFFM